MNKVIFSLAENYWDVDKGIQTLADLALISISGEGEIMLHCLVLSVMSSEIMICGMTTPAFY
ncbi:unnamed protein product [Thlaspi arvense]|uniref:Uncharacterized protein n=1 Tax=Thlaspi arvense TaxID=13288 RepID=A0AAU9SQQ6_THLAR|nr:unnamed protein product [Thlaspi arvense]